MVTYQRQAAPAQQTRAAALWLDHDGIVYRRPEPAGGDHHALTALQARVWSDDIATPGHQLIAADTCGGVVIGAFHGREAVGFTYAFPAHDGGRVWLHSHQTGVDEACRGRHVGATLKWLQRGLAMRAGYEVITWTFDPLRPGNAHFNFTKLGARARRYKVDYYGPMRDPLNADATTDRLWVEWPLESPGVKRRFAGFLHTTGMRWPPEWPQPGDEGHSGSGPPVEDDAAQTFDVVTTELVAHEVRVPTAAPVLDGDASLLRIEVPRDIAGVRAACGQAGMTAWRMTVRDAFLAAFARGYVVTEFTTTSTSDGARSWYLLRRSGG